MKIKYWFLFLLLSACAHKVPNKSVAYNRLFPNGIYRQQIQLEILKADEVHAGFPFQSLSRVENGQFEVMGLSPFGTTVFEAKGYLDNPDELEIKFFVKPPAFLTKDFIKKTFAQINLLYTLKETDLTKKENSDYYKNKDIELEIYKYNSQSIPSVIKLTSPQWRAYVQTQSFKSLP